MLVKANWVAGCFKTLNTLNSRQATKARVTQLEMTLPVLLVFCSGVLVTLRVETWAVRFLESFQIAPVIATREQGEWKRLYVYTIECKPRDEIESQERGDRASYSAFGCWQ